MSINSFHIGTKRSVNRIFIVPESSHWAQLSTNTSYIGLKSSPKNSPEGDYSTYLWGSGRDSEALTFLLVSCR